MRTFDLQPYIGALPIRFGMTRSEVRTLFPQPPRTSGQQQDDYFESVRVAYERDTVVELGFAPGDFELRIYRSWDLESK